MIVVATDYNFIVRIGMMVMVVVVSSAELGDGNRLVQKWYGQTGAAPSGVNIDVVVVACDDHSIVAAVMVVATGRTAVSMYMIVMAFDYNRILPVMVVAVMDMDVVIVPGDYHFVVTIAFHMVARRKLVADPNVANFEDSIHGVPRSLLKS
ncbi:hypothetical protein PHLCEN_2v2346 [Hermanssonia centrifuga]|uniref:Uncharacterized protein n=1 Tax=Hermanssonia centrifuga TaxID=98765 RepID=A0A2R6RM82_9APHY|nr:hypothetical protein PHLCEN_2v2346 [Hermanssonia centrifuga]